MPLIPFHQKETKCDKKKKRFLISDGITKNVLEEPDSFHTILQFKDNFQISHPIGHIKTANIHQQKNIVIHGKGSINNRLSAYFFQKLQERGIQNHYLETIGMNEQKVLPTVPLPFHIVYHNMAHKDLALQFGLEENTHLPSPFIEFVRLSPHQQKYSVSEDHLIKLELIDSSELKKLKRVAERVNDFLSGLFLSKNLKIVNVKLEFGYIEDGEFYFPESDLLLIDEITPDMMTIFCTEKQKILDPMSVEDDLYHKIFRTFLN